MEIRIARFLGRTSTWCYFQDLLDNSGFVTTPGDGHMFQPELSILPVTYKPRGPRIPRFSVFNEYRPTWLTITPALDFDLGDLYHSVHDETVTKMSQESQRTITLTRPPRPILHHEEELKFQQLLAKTRDTALNDKNLWKRVNAFYYQLDRQIRANYKKKWEFLTHLLLNRNWGKLSKVDPWLSVTSRGSRSISCLRVYFPKSSMTSLGLWILERIGFTWGRGRRKSSVYLRGIVPLALHYPAIRALIETGGVSPKYDGPLKEALNLAKNWWNLN